MGKRRRVVLVDCGAAVLFQVECAVELILKLLVLKLLVHFGCENTVMVDMLVVGIRHCRRLKKREKLVKCDYVTHPAADQSGLASAVTLVGSGSFNLFFFLRVSSATQNASTASPAAAAARRRCPVCGQRRGETPRGRVWRYAVVFFVARGAFIHALSCVLVCIGTLTKVANEIPVDNKTPAGAEKSLKDYCKTAVNKENRFVTSHVVNTHADFQPCSATMSAQQRMPRPPSSRTLSRLCPAM